MHTQVSISPVADVTDDALRRTLQQELHEREQLIAELAHRAAPHIDPVAWSTTGAAKLVANQIKNALARLDAGTYGSCAHCGGPIPAGRLEAVPYATSCLTCQGVIDRA